MFLEVLVIVLSAHVSHTTSLSANTICKKSSGKVKTSFWSTKTTTVQTQVVAPNGETLQVKVDCKQPDGGYWKIRSCSPEAAPGLKIAKGEAYTIFVKDSYYTMECRQDESPSLQDTFMDLCKTQLDEVWSQRAKNGYKPSKEDKKRTTDTDYSVANPGSDGAQLSLSLTVACLDSSPAIRSCAYKDGNRFLDSVTIEAGSEANILYTDTEYRLKCRSRAYPAFSKKDELSYIEKTCQAHLQTEQAAKPGASLKSLASTAKDVYTRTWELEWNAGSEVDKTCSCRIVKETVRIVYSCFGPAAQITECRRGQVGIRSVTAGGSIDFRCSKVVNMCSISCSATEEPTLSCSVDRNSPAYKSACDKAPL